MHDWKDIVRRRLAGSKLAPAREAEIVEEISQHLRDRYEELRNHGAQEEEAYRAARQELEAGELARELTRTEPKFAPPVPLGDDSGGGWLSSIWMDIRYGLRVLRLNPGFTAVCVVSLALGIGANTAIFQLLETVRMRALPVQEPQELAVIRISNRESASGTFRGYYPWLTNPQWEQIKKQQQGFSGVLAWSAGAFNLADGGETRSARALWVSGGFFDVLGVPPLLGRVLHESDDQRSCGAFGIVLSHSFWQREFGGDANIVGRTLALNGRPVPILGVTPAYFYGVEVGRTFDLAIPLCAEPVFRGEYTMMDMKQGWWLAAMGRLKPGWTLERATAQLEAISPALFQETLPPVYQPDTAKNYLQFKLGAFAGATGFSGLRSDYQTPLWLLMAIAGLVLLIACANLANLMLARAGAREREIAVRLALGAARGRLIRQLLTESALLAAAGAVAGVVLAQYLSRFMVSFLSTRNNQVFVDLSMNWRMIVFTVAVAALTCLLFGLVPAIKASGSSPANAMKAAGRTLTATRERFSLRRALVVAQVAMSLVLVVSAFLFVRTLRNLMVLDAGFQREGVLIMEADFTRLNIPMERRVQFRERLLERVRAVPGIESAAHTAVVPLSGNGWNQSIIIDNKVVADAFLTNISPGYFKTIGTPILAGRDFDSRDSLNAPRVAIVTETFVQKFFNGQNPIGKTFSYEVPPGEKPPVFEIVGLAKASKYYDLREDFLPIAFFPHTQDARPDPEASILMRSRLPLDDLIPSLRHAMAEVDRSIDFGFRGYDRSVRERLLSERLLATLSGFFGVLAGVLATVGLYGVIAYTVVQRTNEIGIRMALGAAPRSIAGMIVREAVKLLALGLVLGALLSLAAGKAAATLLFGLKPDDPLTLAGAALALAVVTVAASMLPATRAARLDPMIALRQE